MLTLFACTSSVDHSDINNSQDCSKNGIKVAFIAKKSGVDWVATAATYNAGTNLFSNIVMVGLEVFNTYKVEKKTANYSANYSKDNGYYELLLNFVFNGKSATNTLALIKAVSNCNNFIIIYDYACNCRGFGMDYDIDAGAFDDPIELLEVENHNDISGTFGGEKARDELNYSAELAFAPPYFDITESDFRTNFL